MSRLGRFVEGASKPQSFINWLKYNVKINGGELQDDNKDGYVIKLDDKSISIKDLIFNIRNEVYKRNKIDFDGKSSVDFFIHKGNKAPTKITITSDGHLYE